MFMFMFKGVTSARYIFTTGSETRPKKKQSHGTNNMMDMNQEITQSWNFVITITLTKTARISAWWCRFDVIVASFEHSESELFNDAKIDQGGYHHGEL